VHRLIDERPLDPQRLQALAAQVYGHQGLTPDDAHLCAQTLVQADLWGHPSHGLMRLPWYVARLQTGVCAAAARPELIVDTGAIAVIDGHDAMGQVLTSFATGEAVARAKRHGIGAVALRRSNHFGTAAFYTLMAARENCVAFLATNASPAMAPWGGRKKVVGTNPWSWACPAGRHAPMVLDIANTSVARGKIHWALAQGVSIPPGWAADAEGAATCDPAAALAGLILPMAQHKGYAIAVVMDMLAGVLTGSGFGAQVQGPYQSEHRSGAGQLLIVLDIEKFIPVAEFNARMEQLIAELKSVPLAAGHEAIYYPGELESLNEQRHQRDGLRLPAGVTVELARLAQQAGVDAGFLRA